MSRSTSSRTLALLTVGLALTGSAGAHDADSARLTVEVDGQRAQVTYALPLRSLAAVVPALDPDGDGILSAGEAERAASSLAETLRPRLRLSAGQGALAPELVGASTQERIALGDDQTLVGVVLRYPAPSDALRLRYRVPRESQLPRRLLVELPEGNTGVLGEGQDEVTWQPASAPAVVADLALEGVLHIFGGWDHLAFLFALLLVARGARRVLILVSAFTVAHSVTLGLTALGVVTPSGPIVEALIAASIVYVAVENLTTGGGKQRPALTFAFGLVHGMGFGGALAELNLSNPLPALAGFNLGVEAGQLLIVALALPLLTRLRAWPLLYQRWIVTGGSLGIGVLGVYWLVERLA